MTRRKSVPRSAQVSGLRRRARLNSKSSHTGVAVPSIRTHTLDAHAESSNEVAASNTRPPTTLSSPTIRRENPEDNQAVGLQPRTKRRKTPQIPLQPHYAFGAQVGRKHLSPPRMPSYRHPEPLTCTNLRRLDTGHRRRESPEPESTALQQWDFVNMAKSGSKRKQEDEIQETPSKVKTTSSKNSAKAVGTTNFEFRNIAKANGILDIVRSTAPKNLEDIQSILKMQRSTPEPEEAQFRKYRHRALLAPNEMSMMIVSKEFLLKSFNDDEAYNSVYNQAFNSFPTAIGFNNGLSPAQPDLVEGILSDEYEPYAIREELGGAAVPTTELALPQMAAEWKAVGKDMEEARLQAAYDGACLVYARNKALKSIGKPDPAMHAYVCTFISDGTTVHTFAHYAEQKGKKTEYHQYEVACSFLSSDIDDHRKGRRLIRNLQDAAKKHSYALRTEILEFQESLEHNNSAFHQPTVIASIEQPNPEGPSPGVNNLADPTADLRERVGACWGCSNRRKSVHFA